MTIIQYYQQTFSTANYLGKDTFQFQRIYKGSDKQKIKLSVQSLSFNQDDIDTTSPVIISIENCPEITSKGFYVDENNSIISRLTLGQIAGSSSKTTEQGGVSNFLTPSVILSDNLPLNKFQITCRNAYTDVITQSRFCVVFQIELYE